jgi:hypothetical protein
VDRPADIDGFATRVVALMTAHCNLLGAYMIGSAATGDLAGAASDIDLLFVTDDRLTEPDRLRAGQAIADLATTSPLRGVEAVLYRTDVLRRPRHPLAYELNVNAGPSMQRSITLAGDPAFWFLLDVAAARQQAITLLGPLADQLIGEVPDDDVRTALLESLRWHRAHGAPDVDAVLTVCRGLHWLDSGRWLSKTAAGQAYLAAHDSDLVREALAHRRAGTDAEMPPAAVLALQERLAAALAAK